MIRRLTTAAVLLAASVAPAFAHLDPAEHGSFMAGVTHPLFGPDHILVMVAVGLWASLLGRGGDRRALWLVPAAFVGGMCAGFAAALLGLPLPFVEPVILATVVAVGVIAAAALDLRAGVAMALVGLFAVFHGHAHGGELGAADALPYGLGFTISTAALHAAGVLFGLGLGTLFGRDGGRRAARIFGGATALGGLWLAFAA